MIAWEESPRQFKMSKQLDEGKFGEDLARKFLNDPIIKVNHGISHYDDVTQDKSYQDKDTDFIVWKKNGKTFGLEAKVDSHNTGNFYLETSVDYFSMVRKKESLNTRLRTRIQTFQRSVFALSNYEFFANNR